MEGGATMSDEILTMSEAAAILKMTERQVYELTRRRSIERMEHPFPAFNIHVKAKRVRRSDLMGWIDTLAKQAKAK
jgi:predicted DNA-binding transcriptional regulator AlpA